MRQMRKALLLFLLTLCQGAGAQQWTDVTSVFLTNPTFNSDNSGWSIDGWCGSFGAVNYGCMEFWNGYFTMSQQLTDLPPGNYRLSVQAYYRCGDYSNWLYQNYQSGMETVTAFLYADDESIRSETALHSVFDEVFPSSMGWGNDWWRGPDGSPYPNTMNSASQTFAENAYWNTLEFEASGNAEIGLYCNESQQSNWCIFDNFKLEYSGAIVEAQSVSIAAEKQEMLVGETMQLTATVLPANTLQKKVAWSSSDERVASINEAGLVTAKAAGSTVITAKTTDGSNKQATLTITVSRSEATSASLLINEMMASNVDEFISPAFNFDGWIELYNPSDHGVELGGLVLSNDQGERWTMSISLGILPAKGYKVVWFDSNSLAPQNVPFKLDTDGGTITISTTSGEVIARQSYPLSMERVSYARTTDGGDTWGLTQQATPGSSNNGCTFATRQLGAPVVDQPSQLFSGQLSVNVTVPAGCILRYTDDGSLPTLTNGKTAVGQFRVSKTTIYRFRLFANDALASPVTSRAYIYKDRDYMLPVVSVITDWDFLYNSEIGIMTTGPNGRPGNGSADLCNWNMDWERPAHFSYLDTNGQTVFSQDVNLEMCGGWSRAWYPHSFKVKGNKELGGNKNLDYPFFAQKPYIRNRTLQIRNGGNDTQCRFKDPALAYIVETSGMDVDVQAYQPVHEFINGEYIGVLNVREPNNKHYVYANYGWDDDEIDQFEMSPDSGYVQKCGTSEAWDELVDVLSPSAANSETYQEICQRLDIDEFTNYIAIEFFYGGSDWPRNNMKAFRHRDGGKFRFVLFDVDAAFDYGTNVFQEFMNKETWTFDELYPRGTGRITAQIKLVTLFRNLLQNAEYRRKFIDAFCMVSGSVFEAERAQRICDELYQRVEPAMNLNGGSAGSTYNSIRSRLGSRLSVATSALKGFSPFGLGSVSSQRVTLDSDAPGAQLFVNGEQVPTGHFDGDLFRPVTLRAVAPAGYVFLGWQSNGASAGTTLKAMGSSWQYYDQGSLNDQNWTSPTFNTSSWRQGNAPLGFSNSASITTRLDYGTDANNKRPTYYFRTSVSLQEAPASADKFFLSYNVDDGFIVYVNGAEAGRFNMPSGTVGYNTFASTYADQFPTGTIELPANLFHQGANVVAVEVHNNAANSTDIIWDASITVQLSSSQSADYYSTDAEISLPEATSLLHLTASYRRLSAAERLQQGVTPVRINEVSGANNSFISDYAKKDDWVELYNTTDEEIDVEGMFLSDDEANPEKWQISKAGTAANTRIPAHGYLLIWCDKREPTNNGLHAQFKVSDDGGVVMLTAADRSWSDKLSYIAHDGNHTVGRYPDGSGDVYVMNVPTIERSNRMSSYAQLLEKGQEDGSGIALIAASNGFRIRYGAEQLLVKTDSDAAEAIVEIFTTDGRLLERRPVSFTGGSARLSVTHLPSGFYVARATTDADSRVACKFMK